MKSHSLTCTDIVRHGPAHICLQCKHPEPSQWAEVSRQKQDTIQRFMSLDSDVQRHTECETTILYAHTDNSRHLHIQKLNSSSEKPGCCVDTHMLIAFGFEVFMVRFLRHFEPVEGALSLESRDQVLGAAPTPACWEILSESCPFFLITAFSRYISFTTQSIYLKCITITIKHISHLPSNPTPISVTPVFPQHSHPCLRPKQLRTYFVSLHFAYTGHFV